MSESAAKSSQLDSASLNQGSSSTPFWAATCWAVVAILPLIAFYAAHFLQKGVPLGFVLADLPYYPANGREVFERGNGLLYPIPYDPKCGCSSHLLSLAHLAVGRWNRQVRI